MNPIDVVAGIIINNGQILCMQRCISKYDYVSLKYEFPGGKVEADENHHEALKRELVEEMEMCVVIEDEEPYLSVNHGYQDFTINLHAYRCTVSSTVLTLKEHKSFVWMKPKDLGQLDWAAADLPIVRKLMIEYIAYKK